MGAFVTLDRATVAVLMVACACAVAMGVIAAAASPLVPAAALLVLLVIGATWRKPVVGVAAFALVVATLPFGVIPVPVAGAQLTFVDGVLLSTFAAVLLRVALGGWRMPFDTPAAAVVVFVTVAIAAFVIGGASGSITPEQIRRFGKLLAGLLFFLIARTVLVGPERLEQLVRWLILGGALQGAIGAGLMALSPLNQLALLRQLQIIGYPINDVLRFVPGPNNTYTQQLRAIGTSVDPNVYGGTLMLALTLIVVQWASPKPVLPRPLLVVLALPTSAGLLLSLSRASWVGAAAGLLFIGVLRYRRVLVLGVCGGLALLSTPFAQQFLVRFVSGFSTADRATAFRLGEYGNALTLVQRYPLLGIGFGGSPDIDVTAGVSSVYLLVAEQTGLVGLSVFVVALASTWWTGLRGLRAMTDARQQGIRASFLAAISAALVAGLLDHYFANLTFPHAVALFWLYAAGLVLAANGSATAIDRKREPERAAQAGPATRRANSPTV